MFKKIIILFLLVILLGGGFLFAQKRIDIDLYQQKIISSVYEATGKRLEIAGKTELVLFPTPMFLINNASLVSEDKDAQSLLVMPITKIEIKPWALVLGKVDIQKIIMLQPEINIVKSVDNKLNWNLSKLSHSTNKEFVQKAIIAPLNKNAEGVSSIEIKGGVLNYNNSRSTIVYDDIDVSIIASKINGPYEVKGKVNYRDTSYNISLALEELYNNIASNLSLQVLQQESGANISLIAAVQNLTTSPVLKGSVSMEVDKTSTLYKMLTDKDIEQNSEQSLLLNFDVSDKDNTLDISNAVFNYGENRGTLNIKTLWQSGKLSSIKGNIAMARAEIVTFQSFFPALDEWLQVLKIPEINLDIIADRLLYKQETFSNAKALIISDAKSFSLKNISFTVMEQTQVVSNFSIYKQAHYPVSGKLNFTSGNFPSLSEWLLSRKIPFKPNTFKKVELDLNIEGSSYNSLVLSDVKAQIDNTKANFSKIGLDFTKSTPAISITGKVGAINLDSYLNTDVIPQPNFTKDTPKSQKLLYLIQHLNPYPQLNKVLDLEVAFLNYKELPISDLKLKSESSENEILINSITGEVGGVFTNISGTIMNLNTSNPNFKELRVGVDLRKNISYSKIGKALEFLDMPLSNFYKNFSFLKADLELYGDFTKTLIKQLSIETPLGTARFSGQADKGESFQGLFDIRFSNARKFLDSLDITYKPSKPIGIAKVTGKIALSRDGFIINDLDLLLGTQKIIGDISYDDKSELKGNLHSNYLKLDDLVPEIVLNLWSRGYAKARPQWDTQALDFSFMKALDTHIVLSFDTLKYDNLVLNKGKINLKETQSKLHMLIEDSEFYKGKFALQLDMDLSKKPYALSGMGDITSAMISQPIFNANTFDIVQGNLTANYTLNSNGSTINDFVRNLQSNIRYTLTGAYLKGANFNKIAELVENTYIDKKAITEKDFIEYIDLYLKQGTTFSSEISGTALISNGVASIDTQPFSVVPDSTSHYKAEINLQNWDISSLWDLRFRDDKQLVFEVSTEGALDTPRRKVISEAAKEVVLSAIKEYAISTQKQEADITATFEQMLKELQILLPQIRTLEQELKGLSEATPELEPYYKEILSLMKNIATEINKIKQLYSLNSKNEEDLQQANLSFTNIESYHNQIKAEYKKAVSEYGDLTLEPIAVKIFAAEKLSLQALNNNPSLSRATKEIEESSSIARKALDLTSKLSSISEVEKLAKNLEQLWDRVSYLENYIKSTSSGNLSGNVKRRESVDSSYTNKLPSLTPKMTKSGL